MPIRHLQSCQHLVLGAQHIRREIVLDPGYSGDAHHFEQMAAFLHEIA